AEVKNRAEAILEQIRKLVPADALKVRKNDVLTAAGGCTFAGRVDAATFRLGTPEGKEREVKLADLRGVRLAGLKTEAAAPANVLPDPGTAQSLGSKLGAVFFFRVTGTPTGSLWGTDVYTNDSAIAKAAVHAGLLKVGETGVVKVTI